MGLQVIWQIMVTIFYKYVYFLQMFAVVHNVCKTLIFGGNFA